LSVLETQEIVKRYKNRTVVDGISLRVETGTVVGLLGPNGAGKTTTFYAIAGFVRPDAGVVLLDGEDITALPTGCIRIVDVKCPDSGAGGTAMAAVRLASGAKAARSAGRAAPTANEPADASAAWMGRARVNSWMPSSSRACAPSASCAIS